MNYEIHLRPKGEKELHYSKYLSVLWIDSSGRVRKAGWRDEPEDKRERGSEKESDTPAVLKLLWLQSHSRDPEGNGVGSSRKLIFRC